MGFLRSRRRRRGDTYLDELVPAGGDNDSVLGVGGEADAGDPLGVALVGDGELAVTEGVPQLDGAVTGTGDDLTVVGGEGDGQDVVGVADEAAGGGAGGELPQPQGLVPRGRQGVSAVRGDNLPVSSAFEFHLCPCSGAGCCLGTYTVGHDVGVTVERSLGVTVLGLVTGEVPDDQGLVTRTRQEHVGAIAL